ncbi:MAG: HAD family phosphatase [Lachnospiraceae bacterium]|nr:HAD family phosphatase [Lachnospiraceae bacterium]
MIRLIAFDLDGTLLDTEKGLSERAARALKEAADRGVITVPATGRLQKGLPAAVRAMEHARYGILLNGGLVKDMKTGEEIFRCGFDREESLAVWDAISGLDAMTDVYMGGLAFMNESLRERVGDYCLTEAVVDLVYETRNFVPDVRELLEAAEPAECAEKFNVYFRASRYREMIAPTREMLARLPFLAVTTSVPNNLELNRAGADKGTGLRALCEALSIDPSETLAVGDGENDVTMLREAGIGVAMKNACPAALAAADAVTEQDNDHDGFALAVERYVLGG